MKLTLNIKPSHLERATVESARQDIRGNFRGHYGIIFTRHGLAVIEVDDDYIVFNIEKRKLKRKRNKKGAYVVTQKPKAIVRYYRIPVAFLEAANLRVVQKSRHFVFEKL